MNQLKKLAVALFALAGLTTQAAHFVSCQNLEEGIRINYDDSYQLGLSSMMYIARGDILRKFLTNSERHPLSIIKIPEGTIISGSEATLIQPAGFSPARYDLFLPNNYPISQNFESTYTEYSGGGDWIPGTTTVIPVNCYATIYMN